MLKILLILGLISGQLVKLPLFGNAGPTLLDVIILILCILGLFRDQIRLIKPPLYILYGFIFFLSGIISLLINPLDLNGYQFLNSLSYSLRFFIYLLFGYLIYINKLPEVKNNILEIITYSGVSIAILGLFQIIFFPDLGFLSQSGWDPHVFRVASTFLDPNFTGIFLGITLIILVKEKKINYYLMIPVIVAFLLTFSRSSLLFLTISLMAFYTITKFKKYLVLMVISVVLFSIIFLSYQQTVATPKGIDRVQSAKFRANSWTEGLIIFKENPLFGVGFNAYKYALLKYNLVNPQELDSRGSTTNDSSFLHILTTTGLIGFALYLLFIFNLLKTFKFNYFGNLLFSILIGLIFSSLFINSLFYPFILVPILLIAGNIYKE